jgi:hypothetical protein
LGNSGSGLPNVKSSPIDVGIATKLAESSTKNNSLPSGFQRGGYGFGDSRNSLGTSARRVKRAWWTAPLKK